MHGDPRAATAEDDALRLIHLRAWWRAAPLVVLIALGAALALFRIGSESVWYDEAVSIHYATGDVGAAIAEVLGRDTNGILYHAALRAWIAVVGQGEGAVRALSALFAVGTLPLVYWIGQRVFGSTVGLVAGLLLATSFMFVAYAQEARMYAAAMLAATASTALLVRAADGHDRGAFAFYGLVAGLSVYVHVFAGTTLLAHAAWLAWRARDAAGRRDLAAALGIAGLVASPLAPLLLGRTSLIGWIPDPTWDLVVATFLEFVGSNTLLLVAMTAALVAGVVLVWRHRRDIGDHGVAGLVVLAALVPIAAGVIASPIQSFLVARYYIVALPPICLLVAYALLCLGRPLGLAAVIAVLVMNAATLVPWYAEFSKYDWRNLARSMATQTRPFDRIVFDTPLSPLPFDYYVRRLDLAQMPPTVVADDLADVLAARPRRIWVAFYRWDPPDAVDDALETAGYRASGRDRLYDPIRVRAFVDRRAP